MRLLRPVRLLHGTLAQLHRTHGVPWRHLVVDYVRFRRLLDARRGDFFTLGLWDRRVPMAERLTFLSDPDRVGFEFLMNPKPAGRAMRDKGRNASLMAAAGVAVPATVAVAGTAPDDVPGAVRLLAAADLDRLLAVGFPDGLVCKPSYGMSGHDVLVFVEASGRGLLHRNGERWTAERLWQVLAGTTTIQRDAGEAPGWKIERRVAPHPALAAAHGPTLSCLRVVSFRRDDGRLQFLAPTWKVPVGDSGVDNVGAGSLTAAVDPVTGVVGTPLQQDTMCWHPVHPETGVRLEGMVLPHAVAAMELSARAAACFPAMRSLGFDVGIAAEGPVVVEANAYWGSWFMQAPHRRGLVQGDFAEFMAEIGATHALRAAARRGGTVR